jgi:hypothetical protein
MITGDFSGGRNMPQEFLIAMTTAAAAAATTTKKQNLRSV